MRVIVEKLVNNAQIPKKAHQSDFCYDVYATSVEEVEPGIWKYGIGLAFQIDDIRPDLRNINLSIDLRPRSSVWKTGLVLCNSVGTIDELYRGEVCAYFYEVISGKEKYKIGDRIGQIKLGFTLPIEFKDGYVDKDTERGASGFGSTGK